MLGKCLAGPQALIELLFDVFVEPILISPATENVLVLLEDITLEEIDVGDPVSGNGIVDIVIDRPSGSSTATDDVTGTSEAGDRIGQALAAVNTAPRAVGSPATLRLAVGITGEAIGTTAKAGAITTFSLLGSPGADDHWIESGDASGIPGAPAVNAQLGTSLHFTATNLYVGMPHGPNTYGATHSLPMSNVTAGGVDGTGTTFQPGSNGLPAAGGQLVRVRSRPVNPATPTTAASSATAASLTPHRVRRPIPCVAAPRARIRNRNR